jgi:ABC-type nickel/cobalt efflux system permease component RcnA
MSVAPPTEGLLDARLTEMMLFVGGGLATVLVLALAIWLFVRATREEEAREKEERERHGLDAQSQDRDNVQGEASRNSDPARRRACAEGDDPSGGVR